MNRVQTSTTHSHRQAASAEGLAIAGLLRRIEVRHELLDDERIIRR